MQRGGYKRACRNNWTVQRLVDVISIITDLST